MTARQRRWEPVLTDTERATAGTYAAFLGDVAALAAAVEDGDWNLAATFAESVQLRAPHLVAAAQAAEAAGEPLRRARASAVIAETRRQCPMVAALHPEG